MTDEEAIDQLIGAAADLGDSLGEAAEGLTGDDEESEALARLCRVFDGAGLSPDSETRQAQLAAMDRDDLERLVVRLVAAGDQWKASQR